MTVTETLVEKLGEVQSWKSLKLPPEEIAFNNYGLQALRELENNEVPFFEKSKHLATNFTGFVRDLGLYGGSIFSPTTLEDAGFAYIENGVIRYTQKDESVLSEGKLHELVSWRDGDFRVDEE